MGKVVALVPAKGNSRRLPGKNKKMLAGLPLFVHSVRAAMTCKAIDDVAVSTDCDEILNLAKEEGATTIKRPVELCQDDTPNFSVCKHAIDILSHKHADLEAIVLLQPTTPFREQNGLEDAIKTFLLNDSFDSLISVTGNKRLRGIVSENNLWVSDSVSNGERAQTIDNAMEMTGHLFILRPQQTLSKNSLLGERRCAWEIPDKWFDVDIDTPTDFEIAQAIAHTYFGRVQPH